MPTLIPKYCHLATLQEEAETVKKQLRKYKKQGFNSFSMEKANTRITALMLTKPAELFRDPPTDYLGISTEIAEDIQDFLLDINFSAVPFRQIHETKKDKQTPERVQRTIDPADPEKPLTFGDVLQLAREKGLRYVRTTNASNGYLVAIFEPVAAKNPLLKGLEVRYQRRDSAHFWRAFTSSKKL